MLSRRQPPTIADVAPIDQSLTAVVSSQRWPPSRAAGSRHHDQCHPNLPPPPRHFAMLPPRQSRYPPQLANLRGRPTPPDVRGQPPESHAAAAVMAAAPTRQSLRAYHRVQHRCRHHQIQRRSCCSGVASVGGCFRHRHQARPRVDRPRTGRLSSGRPESGRRLACRSCQSWTPIHAACSCQPCGPKAIARQQVG